MGAETGDCPENYTILFVAFRQDEIVVKCNTKYVLAPIQDGTENGQIPIDVSHMNLRC